MRDFALTVGEVSSALKKELQDLLDIIIRHPQGLSIRDPLTFMDGSIPKRTIQYRACNSVC
ncbi:MAG: hypothetical protein FJZ58_04415 [Chlamydiae bacterium]|nr:hypothetical protein [Chlamydiota bacterium]